MCLVACGYLLEMTDPSTLKCLCVPQKQASVVCDILLLPRNQNQIIYIRYFCSVCVSVRVGLKLTLGKLRQISD